MKTKPNNSDWQERFIDFIAEFYFIHCKPEKRPEFKTLEEAENWDSTQKFKYNSVIQNEARRFKAFISSELQRERIIAYSQGMTQGYIDGIKSGEKSRVEYAKKVREKTLKEVEGIIKPDESEETYYEEDIAREARNELIYELLSKIKELKKL